MQHHVEEALRQYGLSDAEIERIRIRGERIQRDEIPDGAVQYVSETVGHALRHLVGYRTLRRIAEYSDE